jgi:hypothetical protein
MIEDRELTEHFGLYEMTHTNREKFQEQNRDVTDEQIAKLTELAKTLEWVRNFLTVPLVIHSGYRCKPLNDSVGSTDRSQHLKCEAADFTPIGQDLGNAFRMLWTQISAGNLKVGQLIYETAYRPYGVESWLHLSVPGDRPIELCNQVLRMNDGLYQLVSSYNNKDSV